MTNIFRVLLASKGAMKSKWRWRLFEVVFQAKFVFFFGTLTWCLNTSREKSKYLKNDFLYDSKIVLFLLCDTKKGCEAALLQFRSIRNFLNSQLVSCSLKLFFLLLHILQYMHLWNVWLYEKLKCSLLIKVFSVVQPYLHSIHVHDAELLG